MAGLGFVSQNAVFNALAVSQLQPGPITVQNANVSSGAPTAGSTVSVACAGYSGLAFEFSGTWTGSVQPMLSTDNGLTWVNATYATSPTGTPTSSAAISSNPSNPYFAILPKGTTSFRLTATAAMTGTANVTISQTIGGQLGALAGGGGGGGGGTPTLYQANGDNSTVAFNIGFTPANPTAILVYVGGLLQRLTTDYTFSVNTVTFGTAPPTGTNNVQVFGI